MNERHEFEWIPDLYERPPNPILSFCIGAGVNVWYFDNFMNVILEWYSYESHTKNMLKEIKQKISNFMLWSVVYSFIKRHDKEIYWKHYIYLLLIKLLCILQFLASYYLCSVKEENRDKNEKGSIQSSHENGSQYT